MSDFIQMQPSRYLDTAVMADFIQVPPSQGGRDGGRGRGRGGGRGEYAGGRWNHSGRGRGRGGRGQGRGGRGRGGRGRSGGRGGNNPNLSNDLIEEIGDPSANSVSIAVEGCCHGELDRIYERLADHEKNTGRKIDLLICCGDFQSIRNAGDFLSSSIPPKYRQLGTFPKYYAGEKKAPILTIFIGGNHEASQPLRELYLGGWVAPNIYYLGAAGVVRYGGLRIGGISGIYKSHDYEMGQYESPPFDRSALRSVYHVRNTDVYRMKCLENSDERLDIMASHDWPLGIYQHGNVQQLLRKKPFFRKEVEQNALGSPPNREILDAIKPKRWFSAHLHVKFEATVVHNVIEQPVLDSNSSMQLVPSQVSAENKASVQVEETGEGKVTKEKDPSDTENETTFHGLESSNSCALPDMTEQMTKFLALDKCLPRRQYLSVINLPKPSGEEAARLEYDPEWLAIVRKTNNLTSVGKRRVQVPSETTKLSNDDIDWVVQRITEQHGDLTIPENFCQTVPIYSDSMFRGRYGPFPLMGNPQTDNLLSILGLKHSITIPFHSSQALWSSTQSTQVIEDENEIDIDELSAQVIEDENEIDIDDLSDGTSGNMKEQSDAAKPHNTDGAEDENEIDLSSIEDANQDHVMDERNAEGVDGISPALKKPRHDVPNELE